MLKIIILIKESKLKKLHESNAQFTENVFLVKFYTTSYGF